MFENQRDETLYFKKSHITYLNWESMIIKSVYFSCMSYCKSCVFGSNKSRKSMYDLLFMYFLDSLI